MGWSWRRASEVWSPRRSTAQNGLKPIHEEFTKGCGLTAPTLFMDLSPLGFRRHRFSETEGAQGHKKSWGCEPAALCEFLVNRLQTILRCRSSWRPNLTCSPPRPAHLSARINYRRVPSRISPPSDLFMHIYLEPVAGNTLRATTPTSYPDRGICGSEDMSA